VGIASVLRPARGGPVMVPAFDGVPRVSMPGLTGRSAGPKAGAPSSNPPPPTQSLEIRLKSSEIKGSSFDFLQGGRPK
jgi:hypothetical protein